jgi:hypothetical protein
MKRNSTFYFLVSSFCLIVILLSTFYFLASIAYAVTNINSVYRWAWNDLIGWLDLYSTNNVEVSSTKISGYASSQVGYIAFDCATTPNGDICAGPAGAWKVSNDGAGNLSGWAWNDQVGWIVFNCANTTDNCVSSNYKVKISSVDSSFSGWAWNDVVGWFSFNCSNTDTCATSDYKVLTSWTSAPLTGNLTSSIFDTQATTGAAINTIMWRGSLNNGAVRFQIASSNDSAGPWNYFGPGCTSATYYEPAGPDIPVEIDLSCHNNQRYARYKIILESDAAPTQSPTVEDVIINYSP